MPPALLIAVCLILLLGVFSLIVMLHRALHLLSDISERLRPHGAHIVKSPRRPAA